MKSVNELARVYAIRTDFIDDKARIDFTAGFNAAIEQLSQGSGEFKEWFLHIDYDGEGNDYAYSSTIISNKDRRDNKFTHVIDIAALSSLQAKLLKAEQENEGLREDRDRWKMHFEVKDDLCSYVVKELAVAESRVEELEQALKGESK